MLYLLKYAYDKYGYYIDLTDLPDPNAVKNEKKELYLKGDYGDFARSILQRYNPVTKEIDDKIVVKLTNLTPFSNEGKPGNQTHNRRFIRGEVVMTYDINQDYYVEQQFSLPILINMFEENNGYYKTKTSEDGKNVAIVGYPEDIFTDSFSLIGKFHAVADRTFNSLVQRTLSMLGARFHYGHPDLWRASYIDAFGGVSRSYPVNEDIYGGYEMTFKGKKIVNVEFMEAAKAREVSWSGTDGIFRKFGMGAVQQMYGRYVYNLNRSHNFDWSQRLAHFYGGIGYYLRKPIVKWGVFLYLGFMLLMGVSGFAPFANEIFYALLGLLLFSQAITATGYMQEILDKPFWRGTAAFFGTLILMSPFFMAHVFTQAVGASLAMAGIAAYVATGRGFRLGHLPMKDIFSSFAKSHIMPGFIVTLIAVIGIVVWFNPP